MSPRARGGQAVAGAFEHQGVLEFGDGAADSEEHAPDCGGGVDPLVRDHQIHAPLPQGFRQLDQVLEGAAETAEFGDHPLIAFPVGYQQCLTQLRA